MSRGYKRGTASGGLIQAPGGNSYTLIQASPLHICKEGQVVQAGRKIVVTGDVMMESKLASGYVYDKEVPDKVREAGDPISGPRIYLHRYVEAGGAVSLWKIIREVLDTWTPAQATLTSPELLAVDEDAFKNQDLQDFFWRSNIVAKQFPLVGKSGDNRTLVWRIERGLGINRAAPRALERLPREKFPLSYDETDKGDANLVVVEHLNQDFAKYKALWPKSLQNEDNRPLWLLVRWARPVLNDTTTLGRTVFERFRDRTVAIVSIEHLRRFGWQVSRGLSWERTVSDLHKYVTKHWKSSMRGTAHLIVVFFQAGAVLFSRHRGRITTTLVYDPAHLETDWGHQYDGDMLGFNRAMTAAVAVQMMFARSLAKCDATGVRAGLLAGRNLLVGGYAARGHQDRPETTLPEDLEYPHERTAYVIGTALGFDGNARGFAKQTDLAQHEETAAWCRSSAEAFRIQPIDKGRLETEWRLLDLGMPQQIREANREVAQQVHEAKIEDTFSFARDVVQYGTDFRPWCFPTLRFGDLFIVDRKEMESFRALRELMLHYLSSSEVSSPLCIAVFGSPGSGKSFAIKQLSRHLSDEYKSRFEMTPLQNITFNVSQFTDAGSLVSALHGVRDVALKGCTPLVFWDEFDAPYGTTRLGWLRYFLAPMQDGQFQEGPVVHNIGRAIFVFAGGNYSLAEFIELSKAKESTKPRDVLAELAKSDISEAKIREFLLDLSKRDSETKIGDYLPALVNGDIADMKIRDFVPELAKTDVSDTKIRDFVSRLKGLMEVATLDYRAPTNVEKPDAAIMLRRAELLRAYLKTAAPKLIQEVRRREDTRRYERLNIDRGLIRAFLLVQKYKYGARSMEAIVRMSALTGKYLYDRSSLPPNDQLDLHVDHWEFSKLAGEEWG